MHLYGSVWGPLGGARPTGLKVDFITRKCQFFLGDHWIDIGPVLQIIDSNGMHVGLPDLEHFFMQREGLDDGTEEWRTWGPRVN